VTAPQVSKILIFPVKSLGSIALKSAEVGIHGLKWDRNFALVNEEGQVITGKRNIEVNYLKVGYDLEARTMSITDKRNNQSDRFALEVGNQELDLYFSEFFKTKVRLTKDAEGGFQDIPRIGSLSIYSESSLRALHEDLGRHDFDELRLRFRSNIELKNADPYWEEQLYVKPGVGIRCKIGDVELIGVAPRVRCTVPPLHTDTSDRDAYFVSDHIAHRKRIDGERLLQYGKSTYYFAVDMFLPKSEAGKIINVEDPVTIIEEVDLAPLGLVR